jgi:hypothetical protein
MLIDSKFLDLISTYLHVFILLYFSWILCHTSLSISNKIRAMQINFLKVSKFKNTRPSALPIVIYKERKQSFINWDFMFMYK